MSDLSSDANGHLNTAGCHIAGQYPECCQLVYFVV